MRGSVQWIAVLLSLALTGTAGAGAAGPWPVDGSEEITPAYPAPSRLTPASASPSWTSGVTGWIGQTASETVSTVATAAGASVVAIGSGLSSAATALGQFA